MAKLISIIESARIKRVTRQAVHLAIQRGAVDYHKIGGVRVIILNEKFLDWTPRKNKTGRKSLIRE